MGANLDSLLQKIAAGATPWKQAVRVVSAGNITLSALQTIDGVTVEEGDRVLCAGQTAPAECGVYTASAGAWARAIDMDRDSYAKLGTAVHVMAGTSNAGEVYVLTAPATGTVRVGVTSQTWTKYAPAAGSPFPLDDGMGNTLDITAGTTSTVAASDGLLLSSGSTLNIDIDSANDIFLDVGANADVIHLAAAGTDAATISVSTSGVIAAGLTGVPITVSTDETDLTIEATGSGGNVVLASSGNVDVSFASGATVARWSESGGALTLAPQDASLRIEPTQSSSGAGKDVAIGGGQGAASNTGGKVILAMGEPGSGSTTHGDIEFHSGSGTKIGYMSRYAGGNELQIHGTTTLALGGAGTGTVIFNPSATVQASCNTVNLSAATEMVFGNGTTAGFFRYRMGSATIASATTTTVVSLTTSSNRIYQIVAYFQASNDTDNEGATYMLRASFKNVAGTVTQISTTEVLGTPHEDAGQTGLDAVLDFSGTAIRARLTTDAGDTVNVDCVVESYERALA